MARRERKLLVQFVITEAIKKFLTFIEIRLIVAQLDLMAMTACFGAR
jgi:hypothetical protein